MRDLLLASELRQADADTINRVGIPSPVLMERAALAVTEELFARGYDLKEPLLVCGTGNNGGDGVAIARLLAERGLTPRVFCFGDASKRSDDLRLQLSVLSAYGVCVEEEFRPGDATVIVDALYGIGLSREVTGDAAALIRAINKTGLPVVSVDVPSGIDPDSGRVLGCAIRAALTVTFTAGSPGLYLYPGALYSGEVCERAIGIPVPERPKERGIFRAEDADLEILRKRVPFGNKGTFGKVLVVAGSEKICGAAYLAAKAALLTGVGMVRICTHENNREPLSRMFPEALLSIYRNAEETASVLDEALAWADICVIGPGIGTDETARALWQAFLEKNSLPAVLDADALNLLAEDTSQLASRIFPRVLTPHVGEMGRLTSLDTDAIKQDSLRVAAKAAARWSAVCVLKDARTVTAFPDGEIWLNVSGNSALATAGSGDVLAGLIGGVLAQRNEDRDRLVPLAVFLHGRLGERASEKLGKAATTASDLLDRIHEFM